MSDGIEDLKIRIKSMPISEVIGRYISLNRKGHYHLGLCPFHNDSSPSLQVNDNKGMFMCFVDQIGGDAITFVRKKENLSFMDALKDICDRIGIPWDEYYTPKEEVPKIAMAKKVLSKACLLYQKIGINNPPKEFSTFVNDRNLTKDILEEFKIGFAPSGNILTNYLESIPNLNDRKFALQVALEIGIIRRDKNKADGFFDAFRDRIMFSISNGFGDIVGFRGRKTKEYQKGKYINSDQSFVFNKKTILYGFHLAKTNIREQKSVILVEGQMDVIALFKNGIRNAVAVMGVGMGEGALKNLKSIANEFYLALDSDMAGIKAMERINELALSHDIIPKFLDFSPHKDPDEFLENESKENFYERIRTSMPLIDVMIANSIPEQIPEISDHKLAVLRNIFPILAPLKESLMATERIVETAKQLGLKSDPGSIINFYSKFLSESPKDRASATQQKPTLVPSYTKINNANLEKTNEIPISNTEKRLLEELIGHPECLSHSKLLELLDYINSPSVKKFILKLQDFVYEIDDSEYAQMVQTMIDQEEYSQRLREIAGYALFKYEKTELNDKIISRLLDDFKKKLQEELLVEKRNILKNKQPFCTTKDEADHLMQEISSVDKDLMELKTPKKNN